MRLREAFALTLLTLTPIMASACDGVWSSAVSFTNWNNAANWTPCIPGAAGMAAIDTATFPSTALDLHAITLDINAGLSALTINSPNTAYAIFGGPSQLFFNTASPSLNILAGSHALEAFSQVASGSTFAVNLSSGAALSWEQGAIANPAGAFNLNYTGPGELTFEWNGSGLFAASTINLGTGNLSVQNGLFKIVNDIFPHPLVPHGSAVIANNVTLFAGGSLTLQNIATISFDTVSGSTGASLMGNTMTINSGSTFTLNNSGMIIGTAHEDDGTFVSLSSLSSLGGNIVMNNTGDIQTDGVGNKLSITAGPLSLSGGSFSIQNSGTVTDGASGNLLEIFTGELILDNSSMTVSNSGSASNLGFANAIDVNSISLINSSMTLSNDSPAVITNAIGSFFLVNGDMALASGVTLTATNSGEVISMGNGSAGVSVGVNNMILNGGAVVLSNSGTVFAPTVAGFNGFGVGVEVVQNLTLNSGSISLQNSGSVGLNSYGTALIVDQNLLMNGGTLTINSVPTQGTGSSVQVKGFAAINGGVVENNSFFITPSFSIGPAGTVSGTGIFTNSPGIITFINAGTLKPGSPTGTMTIQGNYIQTPTGNFVASFASPSSFSQLNVTGTAQLAGTLTTVLLPGGKLSSQKYPILNAGGGVFGQFNNVVFNFGLEPHVEYLPNSVIVFFTLPVPQYPNYVESLFSTVNHINERVERQMSQLRRRFCPIEVIEEMIAKPRNLLVDNNPDLVSLPAVEEKQEPLKEECFETCCYEPLWSVYLGPKGNIGRVLSTKKNPGFHYDTVGAEAGFDYAFSRLGVGFLADYDHINGRVAHRWGKFDIDQAHASVYATYIRRAERQLAFNLIVGGGYEWYHIHRRTPGGTTRGNPHGAEFDALGGIEYTIENACSHWQIIPFANLQYIHVRVQSYHEKGAPGFNLSYQSQRVQSLRSTAGLRLNHTWAWKNGTFTPEINLAWQREYEDRNRHFGVALLGLSNQIFIAQPGRNTALAGIDLLWTLYEKYGIELSYDFEWNTRFKDHFVYLGCKFQF